MKNNKFEVRGLKFEVGPPAAAGIPVNDGKNKFEVRGLKFEVGPSARVGHLPLLQEMLAAAGPPTSNFKLQTCLSLCLFFCLLLFACDLTSDRERKIYTQDDTAVEVGRDVEILYSDSAVVRVRVRGPVLHNFTEREDPRQEFPEGVQIDFLEPDLSVKSTITAKTAVRQQEKGRITARDSVVLVTNKQERLETEELIWDERTAKVSTEKFVKVTKPGEIIYGYGLEADQDFSYWKILVPKGRIKVKAVE